MEDLILLVMSLGVVALLVGVPTWLYVRGEEGSMWAAVGFLVLAAPFALLVMASFVLAPLYWLGLVGP